MRTKKKDILLALEQLRWEGATANEKVKQGTKEALEALEGTFGCCRKRSGRL